jgi:hypothetical protein
MTSALFCKRPRLSGCSDLGSFVCVHASVHVLASVRECVCARACTCVSWRATAITFSYVFVVSCMCAIHLCVSARVPEQLSGLYGGSRIWRFQVRAPLGSDTPGGTLEVWLG